MNQAMPSKLRPALIGGAALGVASAIPGLNCLNCFCCALVVAGGMLAAKLYVDRTPPSPQVPYGDGAVVGLLAGLVGAVVNLIVSLPLNLLLAGANFGFGKEQFEEALKDVDLPPEAMQFIESIGSGGLAAGGLVFGFLINLVTYAIFAALGGILGMAVFARKRTPPPPPSM